MAYSVYRYIDAHGTLLYIGMSGEFPQRNLAHKHSKEWFSSADKVMIEHFATRKEALAAEAKYIASEKPQFTKLLKFSKKETMDKKFEIAKSMLTNEWQSFHKCGLTSYYFRFLAKKGIAEMRGFYIQELEFRLPQIEAIANR